MHAKTLRRILALTVAVMLVMTSAFAADVKPGQTISGDSKWINSDIIGAVDETVAVSLRDDFHTAVNREWILSAEDHTDPFTASMQLLYDRKLAIAMDEVEIDPANADAVGLSSEWLAHDLKLVQTFASLAGEWEYRDRLGAEPARPYLEAIASIGTMEELNAYLLTTNPLNISGQKLTDFAVIPDPENGERYSVAITPNGLFTLMTQDEYLCLMETGRSLHFAVEAASQYLLGRLGYSEKEIRSLLTACYRFEGRLAEYMSNSLSTQTLTYINSAERLTLDEAAEIAGAYPLRELLAASGLDGEESYLLLEERYFRRLDHLYQPRYLEEIKAMLTIQTVMELMPLLDQEAYAKYEELQQMLGNSITLPEEPVGQNEPDDVTLEEDAAAFVFENYLAAYLAEPLDQIYVAAYCTPELKNEIREMIDDAIVYYRSMIQSVDWLSQGAKDATVEKLENLVIRCVYPDSFTDFTGLTFRGYRDEQPGTLPDAVAAIQQFSRSREYAMAGQPVVRGQWDLNSMSTTVCNAYYNATENSINILAGILTDEMYAPDFTYEEKLGTIGVIIGHEITHAFDTNGYRFDKNGKLNPWWDRSDVEAFDLRASSLIKYYNALTPYPGAVLYNGNLVSGEAIADMGGMKCMLGIASDIPGFDYEAFFTAYAGVWRTQQPLALEKASAFDVHPLGFLRTNVTVQQFDEFMETFGVQPGDGMYVAPENRISVW